MRTIEQAAHAMGMIAHREVLEVRESPDGDVVLTHDGRWTLICSDGSMALNVAEPLNVDESSDAPRAPIRVAAASGKRKG